MAEPVHIDQSKVTRLVEMNNRIQLAIEEMQHEAPELIREILLNANLSQADLGAAANTSSNNISRVLTGAGWRMGPVMLANLTKGLQRIASGEYNPLTRPGRRET